MNNRGFDNKTQPEKAQLKETEEKQVLKLSAEKILEEKENVERILSKNSISSYGFNFDVYAELLPVITRLANGGEDVARVSAVKLAILFGNAAKVIQYLEG
jgi:hypothetical protein